MTFPGLRRTPFKHAIAGLLRRAAAYAVLIVWALICVFPFYWVIVTSLKGEQELTQGPFYLPFIDFMPTLKSWDFILFDPSEHLLARYFNSAAISLSATGLTLLLASMAVYGLTRFRQGLTTSGLIAATLACSGCLGLIFTADPVSRLAIGAVCVAAAVAVLRYGPRQVAMGHEGIVFALLSTRLLPPIVVVLPLT